MGKARLTAEGKVRRMPRTREEEAAELYSAMRRAVRDGDHGIGALPGHLRLILKGTVQFEGPLWQVRIFNAGLPTEKVFTLDKFEDYLLEDPRDGLGFDSLHQVKTFLEASTEGEEALELLRAEIEDFDKKANAGKVELIEEKGAAGTQGPNSDNVTISTEGTGRGNSQEYGYRRLLKDFPAFAQRVKAGELSTHKALLLAGIRSPTVQFTARSDPDRIWETLERKFGERFAKALLAAGNARYKR